MSGDHTLSHTSLQKQVIEYLELNGAWILNVAGGAFQRPGIPDLLACMSGRLLAIEVKTGTGVPTLLQTIEIASMRQAGALALVCRRVEELEDVLISAGVPVRNKLRRMRAPSAQ